MGQRSPRRNCCTIPGSMPEKRDRIYGRYSPWVVRFSGTCGHDGVVWKFVGKCGGSCGRYFGPICGAFCNQSGQLRAGAGGGGEHLQRASRGRSRYVDLPETGEEPAWNRITKREENYEKVQGPNRVLQHPEPPSRSCLIVFPVQGESRKAVTVR